MIVDRPQLRLFAFGLVAMHLVACGEVKLPPPAAPERKLTETPEVPTDATPEGAGRVVLEANGEKARVVEVSGATVQSYGYSFNLVAQRPVCASTPCVVDLARGPHRLVFVSQADGDRGSAAEIDVSGRPKVIRHAMGERIEHGGLKTGSNTALTLGVLGALTGGSVLAFGAIRSSSTTEPNAGSGAVGVGGAVLGISAGVIALGVTLGILGRTEVRPGTTTEWTLDSNGNGPTKAPPTTTHVRLAPSPGGLGLSF